VQYIGPQPPPSEDEVMDMVVDEIARVAGDNRPASQYNP